MKTMPENFEKEIFKNASKTYFTSSLFFPKVKRLAVFELYSFVRLADDFVDDMPQDKKSFYLLKKSYEKKSTANVDSKIGKVLKNIYKLQKKYLIDDLEVNAFLKSMSMDLNSKNYKHMKDTLDYIYGSAEVIGIMMAKILELKPEAYKYARYQGRSMQYINFIRDIEEDINLGRCYFPQSIRNKYSIKKWNISIRDNPKFDSFIRDQIETYAKWQKVAKKGWKYIPYRSRIAVMTASDGYNWTARRIHKKPTIVFNQKIKPSKYRLIYFGIKNTIYGLFI